MSSILPMSTVSTRAPSNRHGPTFTDRLPNDDRGAARLFKDEYRGAKHIGKSPLEVGLLVSPALVHWNDYVSSGCPSSSSWCRNDTDMLNFISLSLWIPLKSTEEGDDPEKAQKLEEMIVILRKVSCSPIVA